MSRVVWYNSDGTPHLGWTCSNLDCSTCEGSSCQVYSLIVSSEGASTDDRTPISDCRYGDSVKLEMKNSGIFTVREISISGIGGETTCLIV